MGAADGVNEQQWIEADEQRGGQRVAPKEPRGAPHERDDAE